LASCTLAPDSVSPRALHSKATGVTLHKDQVVRFQTPGGGGRGAPFDRDPAAVLRDIRDGYISKRAAERDYGVVVDRSSSAVDEEATRARRSKGH
jgi:N-methylhydantoinase B